MYVNKVIIVYELQNIKNIHYNATMVVDLQEPNWDDLLNLDVESNIELNLIRLVCLTLYLWNMFIIFAKYYVHDLISLLNLSFSHLVTKYSRNVTLICFYNICQLTLTLK
jgi:hypothetical protein